MKVELCNDTKGTLVIFWSEGGAWIALPYWGA